MNVNCVKLGTNFKRIALRIVFVGLRKKRFRQITEQKSEGERQWGEERRGEGRGEKLSVKMIWII